ncbi:hypothetical protein ACQPX6_20890 [Actinomycetospora sp. CA-101289]|uniref:hypothetical protein n=1 Tax=Actinomycetospora sp. CA-101289 TaxID=3239893 RepID=UPI003D95F34B
MRRPVLVLLVATLLLAGGGVATAAWTTNNTGTATAKAGSMGTPTGITIGTPTACSGGAIGGSSTVPVSWTAVDGATQYTVTSSQLAIFLLPQTKTATGRSTTISGSGPGSTIYVRVTASAGKWTGSTSTTVSKQIAC